jgi:hypothetical protein
LALSLGLRVRRILLLRLLLLACHLKLKVIRTIDGSDWLVDELWKTAVDYSQRVDNATSRSRSSQEEERKERKKERSITMKVLADGEHGERGVPSVCRSKVAQQVNPHTKTIPFINNHFLRIVFGSLSKCLS